MKKSSFLLIVLLSLTFSSSWATKVLILGGESDTYINDVYNKISATGFFETVDQFSASTGTPSLEQLLEYDAVLFWTQRSVADKTTLGNNIAAYIDNGGGFVDMVFHIGNYLALKGNFTDEYKVIVYESYKTHSVTSIDKILAQHPILENINTFSGTRIYHASSNTLQDGSYVIANTNDNDFLIAARENVGTSNARRASLNFWPVSSDKYLGQWDSSTDGARLIANALLWVAGGSISGDKKNNIVTPDTLSYTAADDEVFQKWLKKQNDGEWEVYNTTDTFLIENYDTVSEWHYMVEMLNDSVLDSTSVFTVQSKYAQSITISDLPEKAVGDANYWPGATASSGLTVTYSSANESVASIVDTNIHVINAGTCEIYADQAGNDTYWPAPQITKSQIIKSNSQAITFPVLEIGSVGDDDLDPSATSTSNLTVTYTSSDEVVATIVNGMIHYVSSGTCTIYADQVGNDNYATAPQVSQTLVIDPKPIISNPSPIDSTVVLVDSIYQVSTTITTLDPAGIDSAIVIFGFSPETMTDTFLMRKAEDAYFKYYHTDSVTTYFGQIVAIGNNGQVTKSEIITIISTNPFKPVCEKVYPSQDTTYTIGDDLFVGVKASVDSGAIDKVIVMTSIDGINTIATNDVEMVSPGLYGSYKEPNRPLSLYIKYAVIANNDTTMSDYILFTAQYAVLDTVTALEATDISENSFTAHWTSNPEDEAYLVDVFTISDSDTSYVIQNESVSDTFYTASGLNQNTVYYYNVRVENELEGESDFSNTILVRTALVTSLQESNLFTQVYGKTGELMILTNQKSDIKVYEITGQLILQNTVEGNTSIALKHGVYLVRAGTNVTKVAVQ